jgi:hypothetical protein
MIDTLVTVLILVSSINEGPEVKQHSGVFEIGCIAVILGVNRKIVGDLSVSFFLLEGRLW